MGNVYIRKTILDMDKVINVDKWLEENKNNFKPPVCNKLMHNDQLSVMFVGGPNIREDYHIEVDEELFLQVKGKMCVKIVQEGKTRRDVVINEGEMWWLPKRIPHSPQRYPDTCGLVIERRRLKHEIDGLRYYIDENSTDILWQKWTHVNDLGTDLVPIITEFLGSDMRTTRVPDPKVDLSDLYELDITTVPTEPFNFNKYVDTHLSTIIQNSEHGHEMFPAANIQVNLYASSSVDEFSAPWNIKINPNNETWFWVLRGPGCEITLNNSKMLKQHIELQKSDSVLVDGIAEDGKIKMRMKENSVVISICLPGRSAM